MSNEIIPLGNNVYLPSSQIEELCNRILREIESELPAEAHSHDAYVYVLDRCNKKLNSKIVVL